MDFYLGFLPPSKTLEEESLMKWMKKKKKNFIATLKELFFDEWNMRHFIALREMM